VARLDEVKSRQSETWSLGDYASIGSRLTMVSELLCEAADLRSTWSVLDVATGPGSTALAAARRGCRVVGVDISEALLAQARARANAEGLEIEFAHEDAEHLPYPDGSFDAVLSTFGVPFTPSPERVASEVLRVLRPGGRFALTHWTVTGANAAEGAVMERFAPSDGPPSPRMSEEGIRSLFGDGVTELQVDVRQVTYRFESIDRYIDLAMTRFGPFMRLADSLAPDDRAALCSELVEALDPFNQSGDDTMVLPFDYHEIVATRR
jgi:ubiquinone/menaquinone biosynthesis C-methylase UbiE